jgi:hypothetical protein
VPERILALNLRAVLASVPVLDLVLVLDAILVLISVLVLLGYALALSLALVAYRLLLPRFSRSAIIHFSLLSLQFKSSTSFGAGVRFGASTRCHTSSYFGASTRFHVSTRCTALKLSARIRSGTVSGSSSLSTPTPEVFTLGYHSVPVLDLVLVLDAILVLISVLVPDSMLVLDAMLVLVSVLVLDSIHYTYPDIN